VAQKAVVEDLRQSTSVDAVQTFRIRAIDAFGNTAKPTNTTISAKVVRSGTAAESTHAVTIINSIGILMLEVTSLEQATITLEDSFATGLTMGDALTASFAAGVGVQAAFLPRISPGIAGTIFTVQVQLQDQYGNLAMASTTTVTVQAAGNAVIAGSATVNLKPSATISIINLISEDFFLSFVPDSASLLNLSRVKAFTVIPGELRLRMTCWFLVLCSLYCSRTRYIQDHCSGNSKCGRQHGC
jgi:hypothetical protein